MLWCVLVPVCVLACVCILGVCVVGSSASGVVCGGESSISLFGIVLEYLGLFLAWILLLVACFVFSLCVVVCVVVSRLVVRLSERAAVVGGLGFTSVCIGGAGIILVSDL